MRLFLTTAALVGLGAMIAASCSRHPAAGSDTSVGGGNDLGAGARAAAGGDAASNGVATTAADPAGNAADRRGIEATLAAYNDALNRGRTDAVLPLYTGDGVFMPPYSRSAIGQDAIRAAYDAVFRELSFKVKFDVAELVQLAPQWAYVRTNSAGTTHHASTGTTGAEANQELFLFRKGADGRWRIARYSFSPTSPPSAR